jgi:transposase
LDQYQDEIFRLPLRKQLFILGPAGTGKTTTLIRRLGQKLDTAYLEPEERDLIQAISASGGSSHRDSWLMFTPTELLKQYLKGQMRWKVFSGALNTKIMIGFMKRLVHGRPKRVFLILDNLRVHHSKAVKKWLAENEEKIRVFYLPSYSPELNPDELLNADLKQQVTKAAPPRNKIALTRTAIGALRSIQKQPGRVESYFGQKDVTYAA